MKDEDIAREFMWAGFVADTKKKDKQTAMSLYWIGMQAAWKAKWEPHRWATLFERVLIILRKNKNYEIELQVLDDVIPRFAYLAKYHKWESRREKVKQLIQKKSGIKGFLNLLLSVFP